MANARIEDVEAVIQGVVHAFHRLRALAEELFDQGETSAGRRGLMRSLDRHGPQTVPALARARPVSRQYMQVLVNELEAERLVALVDNPAHRRSKLVALTARGRKALRAMDSLERPVLEAVATRIDATVLRETSAGLAALRVALDDPGVLDRRRRRRRRR